MKERDALTGLLNREHLLAFQEKQKHEPICEFALLFVDIDHLKRINDNCGLNVGDLVIRHASATIEHAIHLPQSLSWRFGGDEFLVFMPKIKMQVAAQFADIIKRDFSVLHIENQGFKQQLSVTIGVAVSDGKHLFERVMRAAENASHKSGNESRNRVVIASEEHY